MSKPVPDLVGSIEIVKAGYAKRNRAEWNKDVYHPAEDDSDMSPDEWRLLRYTVIKRDHQKCKRCDKRFKITLLSAHHIMPRDEGGSNDMSNLVTLCHPCHDFVEINHFKTLAEIIGSYDDGKREKTEDHEPVIARKIPTDWRTWVYGSARNPKL